jgi:UDP-N-acetylmuramyl pentapeptide phosphotransferase/UDP-N-acetylglucosamine-1-phosphate transferase
MPPLLRLLAHLAAAGVLMFAGLPQWPLAVALCTLLGVVWMTNLYNFMDGSDGLAGGMTVAGFGCYAIIAAAADQTGVTVVSASIAACALMFLAFNFHPARIFMGDIGSIPLGFLAAALGAIGWSEGLWSPLVPLLAFSPFIADATVTLTKRLLAGEKVWLAHKSHYYQRVIRMGFGHRKTALAAYVLMITSAASAVAIAGQSAAVQLSVTAVWAIIYLALALVIDRRWRRHEVPA